MSRSRPTTVVLLGLAQTLAWASSFYIPAVLAVPMARDLGVTPPTVFLAFSMALVVSALLGPWAGRSIDRWGGRPVLLATNLVFALGLLALARAQGPWGLFGAWVVLGLGMGSGLYEAAFATLVRIYGKDSRNAITGITLIAGLASTVGWPLSTWAETQWGWRGACLMWAAAHLLLGMPLNAALPRATPLPAAPTPQAAADEAAAVPVPADAPALPEATLARAALLLAFVFAVVGFISTAMAAHLPRLLQAQGATLAAAVAAGALLGPAQVGGRLLEFGVLRRVHPLLSARLAGLAHPLAVLLLMAFGAPAVAAFAMVHGAGNGILTIAKGTLPLVIFGAQGYGQRQGLLMLPARVAQALAPWVFGLGLDRFGGAALWLSCGLGLAAFAALLALPSTGEAPQAP